MGDFEETPMAMEVKKANLTGYDWSSKFVRMADVLAYLRVNDMRAAADELASCNPEAWVIQLEQTEPTGRAAVGWFPDRGDMEDVD